MIPVNFYYLQKSLEDQYSYTPIGDINVTHLIRSQPYWKLPVTVNPPASKTLIVADWTIAHWSNKKRQKFIKKIFELLNMGFTIYAWQAGQIEAITKDNFVDFFEDSQSLDRMTPIVANEVEKQAIRELPNSEKDRILVLDDYQINCLLDPKLYSFLRELDSVEIVKTKHQLKDLAVVLEQAIPPITTIVDSTISEDSYRLLEELKQLVPQIPHTSNFQSATLTGAMVEELLANKEINIANRKFSLRHLGYLEKITLDKISSEALQKLLPLLPNIKKLHLTNFNDTEISIAEGTTFPCLKKIKLSSLNISATSLQNLLTKSPVLNALYLNTNARVNGDLSLSTSLNSLETIILKATVFSAKSFQNLITQSNLKKLILANGEIAAGILDEQMAVPSLETLEIIRCKGQLNDFNNLLYQFSNLKHLTIVNADISEINKKFALNELKILKIDRNLFTKLIVSFANTKFEKLILLDQGVFSEELKLYDLDLSKLKYLTIDKSKLHLSSLEKALQKAPNLIHLNLHACLNLKNLFKPLTLPLVESLESKWHRYHKHCLGTYHNS